MQGVPPVPDDLFIIACVWSVRCHNQASQVGRGHLDNQEAGVERSNLQMIVTKVEWAGAL